MSFSLPEFQRAYLQNLITGLPPDQCLVLDDGTEQLLYSCFESKQLLRHFVAVEKIKESRKSRGFIGIYILFPSRFSISCLCADFTVQPSRYRSAIVFLLPGITPDLELKIKALRDSGKLQFYQTLYLNFKALESRVFSLNLDAAFQVFYNKSCGSYLRSYISQVADGLVSVCVATGEYPIIRYYSPETTNYQAAVLSKVLAESFQERLDDYARLNSSFPPQSSRPRSVFMIMDRTVDLFAPLLHEFTYQALAHDVCELPNDSFTYKAETENGLHLPKTGKLEESDKYWRELRHLNIGEAAEAAAKFVSSVSQEKAKMDKRVKSNKVEDVSHAVLHIQSFEDDLARTALHVNLIDLCSKIMTTNRMLDLAEVEQICIAHGMDSNGSKVKTLVDDLVTVLSEPTTNAMDKVRLVIIYALYRNGLIRDDFEKLLRHSSVKDEFYSVMEAVYNFGLVGRDIVKPNTKNMTGQGKFFHGIKDDSYTVARFTPALEKIVSDLISGELAESDFPYVRERPLMEQGDGSEDLLAAAGNRSLKTQRQRTAWGKTAHKSNNQQRIFVFVAGGMTYSEVRSAYELSKAHDKDLCIGSTNLWRNGSQFVTEVSMLTHARDSLNKEFDVINSNLPNEAPQALFDTHTSTHRPPLSTTATNDGTSSSNSTSVSRSNISLARSSVSTKQSQQTSVSSEPEKKGRKRSMFKKLLQ